MKTIGIIGGMGPEATAALYMHIVGIFQRRFGAKHDADYPPMIICSLPAPDVVKRIEDEHQLVKMLQKAGRNIECAGADFFLIACNTVQKHLDAIAQEVSIPFVNLNEEIAQTAVQRGYKTVGILGTEATVEDGFLEKACRDQGMNVLIPNPIDRRALTRVIMTILSGEPRAEARRIVLAAISDLRRNGADTVVLACTDLRLVVNADESPVPLLDSVDVLAQAAVREACKAKSTPKNE
jgi:aspartate racemase